MKLEKNKRTGRRIEQIKHADCLKALLQQELIHRCKENPRYSLRAFAQSLGVENSWLSKVLRGKKSPSARSIERIALRLGLSVNEIQKLKSKLDLRVDGNRKYNVLPEDVFEVISDWYHFAILELSKLNGFEGNEKWIAKKLNISFVEARAAIERLQKVGLIKISETGRWQDTSGGFTTHNLGPHFTSAARRRLQEAILKKSLEALLTLSIEDRDHSSMMMATHSSKLEEAKERIDIFRKELCEFLEDCPEKNKVFQLSVGLFPISKN